MVGGWVRGRRRGPGSDRRTGGELALGNDRCMRREVVVIVPLFLSHGTRIPIHLRLNLRVDPF